MGAALVSPCVFPESISMPPPSGVNNIFALLDEDNDNEDDGFTVVAKTAKPAKAAPKEEPKREARKQKTDRPARGGKGDKRRDERPYDGADKSEPPAKDEGRKGGKGERREGKGERKRGKGGGRREFDRQSQTGRGKGSAREGRGNYNWGDKTDGASEPPADGAPADGENKAPPPPEEEEEEENTMTLEEYMKAQANRAPVGKVLQERKVEDKNEGFLKTREAENVGHNDAMYGMAFHDYDGKHKDHEEKEAREGWVDADNVFNLKFVDPNAGGKGDRQGKGGKKGSRNDRDRNGGGRGQKQGRPQGKIELGDVNAFPSL